MLVDGVPHLVECRRDCPGTASTLIDLAYSTSIVDAS
jgi:hypothetical protein